jgi:hypothetical protein
MFHGTEGVVANRIGGCLSDVLENNYNSTELPKFEFTPGYITCGASRDLNICLD